MIVVKLALRNLFRNTRRTLLTATLIILGVILVITASSVTAGFRTSVIDALTNTQLSHFQVHKNGYMDSIDSIPLNIFMNEEEMSVLSGILSKEPDVEVFSPRIRLAASITYLDTTTNIRLTAVYPEKESVACPGIIDQMSGIADNATFLKPGEIIIPDAVARGLQIKEGDVITLAGANRHGERNSMDLTVAGVMTTFESPQGRSGYMHIDDVKTLLQMDTMEVSEVAVRIRNFDRSDVLNNAMSQVYSQSSGQFEVHSWEKLSPFSSILALVNLVNVMVQFILIAIVLISVLNIMMMSVYERTHEIGTIAAIGTTPGKIVNLFLGEGIMLGLISTVAGTALGLLAVYIISRLDVHFKAGPFVMSVNGEFNIANILATAALVVVISLIASFQPAFKASRLEPVEALGNS